MLRFPAGMELRHNLSSGGINKLTARKLHKPPHIEKQTNSIPVRESIKTLQFNL